MDAQVGSPAVAQNGIAVGTHRHLPWEIFFFFYSTLLVLQSTVENLFGALFVFSGRMSRNLRVPISPVAAASQGEHNNKS